MVASPHRFWILDIVTYRISLDTSHTMAISCIFNYKNNGPKLWGFEVNCTTCTTLWTRKRHIPEIFYTKLWKRRKSYSTNFPFPYCMKLGHLFSVNISQREIALWKLIWNINSYELIILLGKSRLKLLYIKFVKTSSLKMSFNLLYTCSHFI